MQGSWLLLIYTVPSQPTRKRASVWRELKKLGSIYLRDGVAVLPALPELEARLQAVADRILQYEGTADLIVAPQFPRERDEEIKQQFQEERSAEYREVYHACVRFLRDVLDEVSADEFGFPDVGNLESELSRLTRYYEQIRERDYFGAPGINRVAEILEKCETAFERFIGAASERGASTTVPAIEDVFTRLGGPRSETAEHDDLPF
jgi:DNA repair photolyase